MTLINDVLEEFMGEDATNSTCRRAELRIKKDFPGNYIVNCSIIKYGLSLNFYFETPEDETIFRLRYSLHGCN